MQKGTFSKNLIQSSTSSLLIYQSKSRLHAGPLLLFKPERLLRERNELDSSVNKVDNPVTTMCLCIHENANDNFYYNNFCFISKKNQEFNIFYLRNQQAIIYQSFYSVPL